MVQHMPEAKSRDKCGNCGPAKALDTEFQAGETVVMVGESEE